MIQILDLHIHSKYSRACSKHLTLENISKTCRIKGVNIIATGDFTHPSWFKSIKNELSEISSSGLYVHKKEPDNKIKFILGTEISLIYKDDIKCRRIHLCIHAPNIKAAQALNNILEPRFNIKSDGRPILGISAHEFTKLCLKIHPNFIIYPAHIWTPWYSMFGSKSGFDSIEECFKDQANNIFAYETGLSSDPQMNWRITELDNLTLLSSSDAHSLPNIGREATIFNLKNISYQEIYQTIKTKDLNKIIQTIEFHPEEGTYHHDGHRACNFSCSANQTKKLKKICPKCKRELIIGVEYRVNELANRAPSIKPNNSYGYTKLVELDKIIAQSIGIKSRKSKKVTAIYNNLINTIGPELEILLNTPLSKLKNIAPPHIIEGIKRVRNNNLHVEPGYDGEYGKIKIFTDKEINKNKQLK